MRVEEAIPVGTDSVSIDSVAAATDWTDWHRWNWLVDRISSPNQWDMVDVDHRFPSCTVMLLSGQH